MKMFRKGQSQRGSALVLVVLLSLVLSALAIVAMRNVARSARQASVFHTRAQSQNTSSSAVNLYSQRAGDKAAGIVTAIKSKAFGESGGMAGTYGASANEADRLATATAGGFLLLTDDELTKVLPQAANLTSTSKEQTGLFTNSAGSNRTFEDERSSSFQVIVRDLVDGIPAPRYSGGYCFKKAFIATESRVGETNDDWDAIANVAYSRHGKEVLLGPIECGFE